LDASHNEAADHFAAAVNSSAFTSEHPIHLKYEIFVVVRGYHLTENYFSQLALCNFLGGI
jgi:hypothetical protein